MPEPSPAPAPVAQILALDPSTVRCGVALVRVPLTGEIELAGAWCLHASGIGPEVRIQALALQLEGLRSQWAEAGADNSPNPVAAMEATGPPRAMSQRGTPIAERLLAYEVPYSRTGEGAHGRAGLEWVWAMIGAALALVDAPPIGVSVGQVAAQYRATGLSREAKKVAAVEWARQRFSLVLSARDHDAAEAVAVGCAAGKLWRERVWAAQAQREQPCLSGPRGGRL